jgi:CubicO group peptidase (beta-lactamase class C family)
MQTFWQDLCYGARRLLKQLAIIPLASLLISVQPYSWGCGQGPASSDATTAALSVKVDALMATWFKADSPGAALVVIKNGQIVHRKGYGLANRETKEPFQCDTPSLIGSVAKQFTAMAIMMLAEEGRLSFDDPLPKYLPDFPVYAQKITLRHLLHHTSGLPVFDDLISAKHGVNDKTTAMEMLKVFARQQTPRFIAGDKYEYNNGGYVLLSHIVERVSGKPYAQFIQERIFQPLEMRDSFISHDEAKLKTMRRAIGYFKEWNGVKVSESIGTLRLYNGMGSYFSTVDDLLKWDQALYTEKLVKAATFQEATTPGKLNSGQSLNYGFGWELFRSKEIPYMLHAGGWAGFKSFIVRIPAQRFTVVALSNSNQFDQLKATQEIARNYLGGYLDGIPKPK